MRKYLLVAAAGALSLAVSIPVVLAAATTKTNVGAELRPALLGTPAKPAAHRLAFGVTIANDDPENDVSQPPLLKEARVTLGKGFAFNGKSFPSTTKAKLNAGGPSAATKGSRVGQGRANLYAGIARSPTIPLQVFNGPGGDKIELYVGAPINQTIEGTVSGNVPSARAAARPGLKPITITFVIPKSAIHPSGDTFRSLSLLAAFTGADAANDKPIKITVKGKDVPYWTSVGPCPKNKGIPVTGVATFYQGSDFPGEQFPSNLEPAQPTQTSKSTILC